jgi:hypothetical protein
VPLLPEEDALPEPLERPLLVTLPARVPTEPVLLPELAEEVVALPPWRTVEPLLLP